MFVGEWLHHIAIRVDHRCRLGIGGKPAVGRDALVANPDGKPFTDHVGITRPEEDGRTVLRHDVQLYHDYRISSASDPVPNGTSLSTAGVIV
ncbi:hypothetical protein [Nonomuraea lactucae]|uniref:hypothetical protein n=1 Tax=Nonomuraea lactucae TaxID=2249762 RepID=UPI0013B3F6D6|nr:hypothetical protein [Nonomuraea lactucae]